MEASTVVTDVDAWALSPPAQAVRARARRKGRNRGFKGALLGSVGSNGCCDVEHGWM
jgi:hypothetical protein